jgi:hypothetical protein
LTDRLEGPLEYDSSALGSDPFRLPVARRDVGHGREPNPVRPDHVQWPTRYSSALPGRYTGPVWWDDDPQKEILVDGRLFKYRAETDSHPDSTSVQETGSRPDGTDEDPDGTIQRIEGRVLAIVDCIGDWREEIVTSVPGELRIYTSTRPSTRRRPWLMEDRQYRLGVAAGSMGYYREPQLSGGLIQ